MASKKKPKAPEYPKVWEGWHDPSFSLTAYMGDGPSTHNGDVRIVRYRVTVEKIAESVEVYHERLIRLWRECSNHHHWAPLKAAAAQYGLVLERDHHGIDLCQRYGCRKVLPAPGPGYCSDECRRKADR